MKIQTVESSPMPDGINQPVRFVTFVVKDHIALDFDGTSKNGNDATTRIELNHEEAIDLVQYLVDRVTELEQLQKDDQ